MEGMEVSTPKPHAPPDVDVRPNVAWETYARLAESLGDERFPRLFYARQTLVLIGGPDRPAATSRRVTERVVDHWAEGKGIELCPLGQAPVTATGAAATPSASYHIGQPREDGSPDFVIDDPSLPEPAWLAYAEVGVQEVWTLDVEAIRRPADAPYALQAFRLDRTQRRYLPNPAGQSTVLPSLDLERVGRAVSAGLTGPSPHRAAIRAFDDLAEFGSR